MYFKTHHFPVIELRADRVTVFKDRSEIPYQLFEFLPVGWAKSEMIERRVVQRNRSKVHVLVRIADLDKKGESLGEYNELFILTHRGGRWGVQVRSRFPLEVPEGKILAPL